MNHLKQLFGTTARRLYNRSRGIDLLRDPRTNKGSAFSLREKQLLGIHGLLPPASKTIEQQAQRCLMHLDICENDLNRYIYLINLQDRNEKLFYRVVTDNVDRCMPLVYTPTVGLACQKYGIVYRRPRGLFITIHDKDHIDRMLANWPEQVVKAVVVTDGERILGLGDLGANGMGIPVGKLSLYTALAGVQPAQCLPVLLDVGTDNHSLLSDPHYIGMRHQRIRGEKYDEFIDAFMVAVTEKFGSSTLIQFEDFGNQNAFRFLEKYKRNYCTFNDDIQGTAAVAVAGVLASAKMTQTRISDNTFLFQGAGEASIGIAKLLVNAMLLEGTSNDDAKAKIFMIDSKGLLVKDRPRGGLTDEKRLFAKDMAPVEVLEDIVKTTKPTVLVGAAAVGGVFTPEILRLMAQMNDRPVIFALSNPTDRAECTAEEAYAHTGGRAIFASGSPFPTVNFQGKEYHPGQGNNSYIFPGVALGVICCGMRFIPDEVFLKAAQCLANQVTESDMEYGSLYPSLSKIREVSLKMATAVVEYGYENGLATVFPEPADKETFVKKHIYSLNYEEVMPRHYEYPIFVSESSI